MTYVMYDVETTRKISTHKTERGAKISLAAKLKKGRNYAITDSDNYRLNVVTKITVKNLMSGQDVEIDSNTPACCDPSTELYHCM